MLITEFVDCNIYPKKVIYNNQSLKILQVPNTCIVKGFFVMFNKENKRIEQINLGYCHHPNAIDPQNKVFPPQLPAANTIWCVPDFIKKLRFEESTIHILYDLISVWNYNNCYWKSWNIIEVEKNIQGV